jgi:capsular exopolysaccharide synthesis family protein
MSKIFEALQGTGGEVEGVLANVVGDASHARSETHSLAPDEPEEHAAAHSPATESIRVVSLVIPASAPLLPFEEERSVASEQYRIARTRITYDLRRPKLILLTSPSPGDGKSVSSVNIAAALSLRSNCQVLLLDADFRHPSIHQLLGLDQAPGLADVITGVCTFEEAAIQAAQYPNLHILVNGKSQVNPSELLESARWHALCKFLRSRYDYVIVDSPPVSAVADSELIQMAVDATILVLRPDHTKRRDSLKAVDAIPKDKFLGVLYNCMDSWFLHRPPSYQYAYPKLKRR